LLQKIAEKIEHEHNLSKDEVEQIFINDPHYLFLEKGKINVENVYATYGGQIQGDI
jgi:phosphoketolase